MEIKREKILYDYCVGDVPDGEIDCFQLLDEWDYEKNYPLTSKDVKTVEYRKIWWTQHIPNLPTSGTMSETAI